MPFPSVWVDRLFAKLRVRYGAAFERQYGDVDPALVKADWAEVLDGFEKIDGAIAYGLKYLPTDKPPTALQFRNICRACPAPEVPRLEAPQASPERAREALQRIKQAFARENAKADVLESLREKVKAGTATAAQRDFYLRANAGRSGAEEVSNVGGFNPIPVEMWPPGMREAYQPAPQQVMNGSWI